MARYWVIGGEYQSTKFEKLAPGKQEVREGPFEDYEVAKKVWQRLAWETVDNALAHFHIEQVRLQLPGEVSETQYWVIGGSFGDLDFDNWEDSTESYGPFETYDEAEAKWQEMAWKTVDDASARYRIETLRPTQEEKAESGGGAAASGSPAKRRYRLFTGPDDASFCDKVSAALADGYKLYGQPQMTATADGSIMVCQAVVLED